MEANAFKLINGIKIAGETNNTLEERESQEFNSVVKIYKISLPKYYLNSKKNFQRSI
jgi:hypothetical protein